MSDSQSKNSLDSLLWMVDSWVNADGETVSYEHWTKVNDSLFEGGSETIKNGDTVFSEKLKLIARDDGIFYIADVSHNPVPVFFKLISSGNNFAVFENSSHDFPKKISYMLEEGNLHAYIEGPSKNGEWKKIDFFFNRRR
ncbi:MAG TPA: DUF6265 family protein [Ignavibacteria bacterium]|jgi:hypothetical protein